MPFVTRPSLGPASCHLPSLSFVRGGGRRRGWSLVEVTVVVMLMSILIAMSMPTFNVALEQSKADIAAANLRAIWTAQRLYWLENHAYSTSLSQLNTLGLLDPAVVSSTTPYVYGIQSADTSTFTAAATRTGSVRWQGTFTLDQTGSMAGGIKALGTATILPGFQ